MYHQRAMQARPLAYVNTAQSTSMPLTVKGLTEATFLMVADVNMTILMQVLHWWSLEDCQAWGTIRLVAWCQCVHAYFGSHDLHVPSHVWQPYGRTWHQHHLRPPVGRLCCTQYGCCRNISSRAVENSYTSSWCCHSLTSQEYISKR